MRERTEGEAMYSGKKLRTILQWQGRRQDWLAARTGKSEATISRYLDDIVPMGDDFAQQVALLLDVPVDAFMADKETAHAS